MLPNHYEQLAETFSAQLNLWAELPRLNMNVIARMREQIVKVADALEIDSEFDRNLFITRATETED